MILISNIMVMSFTDCDSFWELLERFGVSLTLSNKILAASPYNIWFPSSSHFLENTVLHKPSVNWRPEYPPSSESEDHPGSMRPLKEQVSFAAVFSEWENNPKAKAILSTFSELSKTLDWLFLIILQALCYFQKDVFLKLWPGSSVFERKNWFGSTSYYWKWNSQNHVFFILIRESFIWIFLLSQYLLIKEKINKILKIPEEIQSFIYLPSLYGWC